MESSKFKLGLFLILSFVLVCALFVVFGLCDIGNEKIEMVTLFEESVQGLEIGSPVKFKGVPIGKVSDITVHLENMLIQVEMEIDVNKIIVAKKKNPEYQGMSLQEFRRKGKTVCSDRLSTTLALNGISGGKYIEIDFAKTAIPVPKDIEELIARKDDDSVLFIPSKPSLMTGLRTNLMDTLRKIATIDYKGISDRMEKVLDSADKLLSNPKLAQTIDNVEQSSAEINKTVTMINQKLTPERFDKLVTDIQDVLKNVDMLVKSMNKAIDDAKVSETSQSFRDAAAVISSNRREVRETLRKLSIALDRLSELLQTLEENPESLLHGKE